MKDTISIRQVGIIMIFCIFANKILLLPSLMYENTKADSIFALSILFVLDILLVPIFIKLKSSYPDKKLYDILKSKTGVFFTKIIYLILTIFFMMKVILVFSITYVYLKQQIYKDEFFWIALISVLPVINHGVMCGVRGFSRTMEIFFGVVLAGFILCLIFSLFTNMSMPSFFVADYKDIFKSIYSHAFTFGDFIFLFTIFDKIEFKKGDEKRLYKYAFFGVFLIILLFFLFYSKYEVTSFIHNNALADLLVFSVEFNAVGRVDIIAMLTIMFITLFQMEIFCFGFCNSLTYIFPLLKNFYAVIFFDITFGILYYLFIGNYQTMVTSTIVWLPFLGIIINYILPLIFLIIALIKNKNKNKKDKIKRRRLDCEEKI